MAVFNLFSARGTGGIALPLAKHVCWNHIWFSFNVVIFHGTYCIRLEFILIEFKKQIWSGWKIFPEEENKHMCEQNHQNIHTRWFAGSSIDCYHVTHVV